MIHESAPWKRELALCAKHLEPSKTDCSDEVPFQLERALFLSAFIVRKLVESRKLTDSVARQKLSVLFHQAIDRHRLAHVREVPGGLEYGEDFEPCGTGGQTKLVDVANQIIHSLAITWMVDEAGYAEGVFICSDRTQYKRAMMLPLENWVRTILSIAEDDVAGSVMYTDAKTGELIKKNYGWG